MSEGENHMPAVADAYVCISFQRASRMAPGEASQKLLVSDSSLPGLK